ncbi:hypothetical protein FNW02_30505 [Komarekiella sp. 'clone 1']|uniref:Uncharacterized protein n=1 Tax=Komarekiella delphini-convector SJRDD-AB1 TaxID=2593771 RepID=A0AA40T321_9NOST|nr:hypothetical protein [Komarekiella delphini-convector]MBD6620013.1 hypothetical protein [Komarekiella delphini-convector SJRDD-AB1]
MGKVIAGKSPRSHYTQISNLLIRDTSSIDDGAFRLICWMTSHDEGFEMNFSSIQQALGYGRDKLRKILKTAEVHNYLVRRRVHDESGCFDWEYHIFKDTTDAIAFKKSLPENEKSDSLNQDNTEKKNVSTPCPDNPSHGSSGRWLNRQMVDPVTGGSGGTYIKEEQYKENQKEEKQTQEAPPPPGAPPTQECACEDESIWDIAAQQAASVEIAYLEELTLKSSSLLLKKSESSQQTDNLSCRSSIAAGSFDVIEQANNQPVAPSSESVNQSSLLHSACYTVHPTQKTEQALRKPGLPPWMEKAGPNGWKAEFVESYRLYLNSTPRYAKELVRQATTGEARNALTRLSKTDSGIAEIQNHWDSFNELKEREQLTLPNQPRHNSNDDLATAIAADEQRRRLEQQRRSSVPIPQPLAFDLKAKLQAAVNAKKVRPNPRFSSADLQEVESQLKLALGA